MVMLFEISTGIVCHDFFIIFSFSDIDAFTQNVPVVKQVHCLFLYLLEHIKFEVCF